MSSNNQRSEEIASVMRQALEYLEESHGYGPIDNSKPIGFLRQAIARAEHLEEEKQKPVIFYRCKGCQHAYEIEPPSSCDCMSSSEFEKIEYYTHPYVPTERQPKVEQEPVAWRETHGKVIKALASIVNVHTPDELFDLDAIPRDPVMALVQDIKAALDKYKPPQPKRNVATPREPLTDKEIDAICASLGMAQLSPGEVARAIEAAHGITKKEL